MSFLILNLLFLKGGYLELPEEVKDHFSNLNETRKIYYEDAYIKEFDARIIDFYRDEKAIYIVLDQTAFFPEGGGQEGDQGTLIIEDKKLKVIDTQIIDEKIVVHICDPKEIDLKKSLNVHGIIDWDLRYSRMKHHTGSHLIFAAVREILGVKNLMYMGVHVGHEWGRIDVNVEENISLNQIFELERNANKVIMENRPVIIKFMQREEAERVYGEKLGVTEVTPKGKVRVVEIKDWDAGLCSGTHVKFTAEIGLLKILETYKLAKGIQRIRFTAGLPAFNKIYHIIEEATKVARDLNVNPDEIYSRVKGLIGDYNDLKKTLEDMRKRFMKYEASELLKEAKPLGDLKVLIKMVKDYEPKYVKNLVRAMVQQDQNLIVILIDLTDKLYITGSAGEVAIKKGANIAKLIDGLKDLTEGKGGGSPRLIQLLTDRKNKIKEIEKYLNENIDKIIEK